MKFAACVFVVSALAFTRAERCETFCTREYRPVCGTDGKSFKTFPNPCVLRNEHCNDGHEWMQTRSGDCQHFELEEDLPCEVPCTRDFRPVCGTDGEHFKHFSNLCMMRNEHCKDGQTWFQTRMESCVANNDEEVAEESQKPKNCRMFCPAIYAPVCGFDGQVYKQFASKCILESDNCLFNNNWAVVSLNKCA